jgi:hypothetical protein
MSPAFSTRRRAEQFGALLEGTLTEAPSAELAALAALADQVRAVPEVSPRAEFTASLRERLMAEAPSALAVPAADPAAERAARLTVAHRPPAAKRRERRLAVALAAASIVGATGASAVASQGALPGDTLYPVKRLLEDARTSMAMGEDAKADVLLAQARTRLQEARTLGTRDEVDAAGVRSALGDFGDDADRAASLLLAEYADHGDAEAIGDLRSFTRDGVAALTRLADLLPESLRGPLAEATSTLLAIDHSAAEACPSCGGGISELPSTLIDLLAASTGAAGEAATGAAAVTPQQAGGAGTPHGPVPSSGPTQGPGLLPGQLTGPLTNPGGGSGGSKPSGGATAPQPSSGPTSVGGVVGGVGGAVGGVVGGVGGAVGGVGDGVGGPVGGVVGGVGGAVGGVGGTVGGVVGGVGGAVDGIVGGVLGGSSQTPKP